MVFCVCLFSLKSFFQFPLVRAKFLSSLMKASQVLSQEIRLNPVKQLHLVKGLGFWRSRPG